MPMDIRKFGFFLIIVITLMVPLTGEAENKSLTDIAIEKSFEKILLNNIDIMMEQGAHVLSDDNDRTALIGIGMVVPTESDNYDISLLTRKGEILARKAILELGGKVPTQMHLHEFETKIIKNTKKAILERIKALEEDRILFDYNKQKNQIVTGRIRKEEYNGYTVDLGYTDALLSVEEQIDEEYYKPGDMIKAYVVNIRKQKKGVVIILSRIRPEFVKKLFENEIPEIASEEVEIKKIVREPGLRTKVAVKSANTNIDAVAACLGPHGIRIETIRKELSGELVDVVLWDDSPEQLIANAIGSDLVEKVYLAERGKFARVIVSAENKNLAIGKRGKNVKLAAKLTDYKLDIYLASEFEEKISEERRVTSHINDLDGVTASTAKILRDHGYTSVQDIFEATVEALCNLEGLGSKTAKKIKESAKYF